MPDDLCGPASTLLPQNSQIPYTTPHVYASQPSIHKENVCLKKKKTKPQVIANTANTGLG